ncbi:hypothetical protein [Nesterenkonia sp. CF4.4]|uniref:hypothetical protein n=1 Tax=Nesterenkonia sp. CF4.4 TaxID=3373079 RepID=UPI003EE62540
MQPQPQSGPGDPQYGGPYSGQQYGGPYPGQQYGGPYSGQPHQQPYPEQYAQNRGTPPSNRSPEGKNFFAALFDFSFQSFVAVKFAKFIYAILIALVRTSQNTAGTQSEIEALRSELKNRR